MHTEPPPLDSKKSMSSTFSTTGTSFSFNKSVTVKVGMLGDSQAGKTSLMVKYVDGVFEPDYVETLGVNFMDKSITLKNTEIIFNIWDLGGQLEFNHMLPLVCNDAAVLLFLFDLTRKITLINIRDWYHKARNLNKGAVPLLIGTKYDTFEELKLAEKSDLVNQARKYAKAMKAPLIFTSAAASININKLFKIVISKLFDLPTNIPTVSSLDEPICEF